MLQFQGFLGGGAGLSFISLRLLVIFILECILARGTIPFFPFSTPAFNLRTSKSNLNDEMRINFNFGRRGEEDCRSVGCAENFVPPLILINKMNSFQSTNRRVAIRFDESMQHLLVTSFYLFSGEGFKNN